MTTLSLDAERCLESYLARVEKTLGRHRSVSAAEVVPEVRSHIEDGLREMPEPVSRDDLESVLSRLGKPDRWVSTEELSPWQRFLSRLDGGSEDWRLAYLALAATVSIVFIPVAYLVARGAVARAEDRGESLGARRWLLYPALWIIDVLIVVGVLSWPAKAVVSAFPALLDAGFSLGIPTGLEGLVVQWAWAAFGLGIWWLVLALFLVWRPAIIHAVLRPFVKGFRSRNLLILATAGAATALVAVAVALHASGLVQRVSEFLR